MQFLIDFIKAILEWLFGFLTWCVEEAWNLVLLGLTAVLNAIPAPSWLSSAPSVFGAIPSGVGYVVGVFQLPAGITIILGAYILRFIIRRIPIIG